MSKKISLEEATMKALLNDLETPKDEVEGIVDGVMVVTDPKITPEEYEEVIERAKEIQEETPEGEVPFDDEYVGEYLITCPLCGSSFVNDEVLNVGDPCPICFEVPEEGFILKGQVATQEDVELQNDIEDSKETLEDEADISVDEITNNDEDIEETEEETDEMLASEEVRTSDKKLEEASEYKSRYDELDELLNLYAGIDNDKLELYNAFNNGNMKEFDDGKYDMWLEDMKDEHFDELMEYLKDKDEESSYYINKINESKKLTEDSYNKGIFNEIEQALAEADLDPIRFADAGVLTKNIGWTVRSSETGESQQITCDGSWYDEDEELEESKKVESVDLYDIIKIGSKFNDGKYEIEIKDIEFRNIDKDGFHITVTCEIKNDKEHRITTFNEKDFLTFLNLDKTKLIKESKKLIKEAVDNDYETILTYASKLAAALKHKGYKVKLVDDDVMVHVSPIRDNKELRITVYAPDATNGFEENTIGLGGDTLNETVLPIFKAGWEYENAAPSGTTPEEDKTVYAMFKPIKDVNVEEIVGLVDEAFSKHEPKTESKKVTEVGETIRKLAKDSDLDYKVMKDTLENAAKELAEKINGKYRSVNDFDKYQGPFAIVNSPKYNDLELWFDQAEQDDIFMIKISHKGWLEGTIDQLAEWLNEDEIPQEFLIENKKLEEAQQDFKIGDIVKVPYKYGSYTPGEFTDAPIIDIEDGKYITVEVPSKQVVMIDQLRKWNSNLEETEDLKESNCNFIKRPEQLNESDENKSEYTIINADEDKIKELENGSAFTWEGMSIDDKNLEAITNFFKENTPSVKLPITYYTWSGKTMNELYGLTKDNAYSDDLTFLSIPLDQWSEMGNLPMVKFQVGARWLDDIVDNNASRETKIDESINPKGTKRIFKGNWDDEGINIQGYHLSCDDRDRYWLYNKNGLGGLLTIYPDSKAELEDYLKQGKTIFGHDEVLRKLPESVSEEIIELIRNNTIILKDDQNKKEESCTKKEEAVPEEEISFQEISDLMSNAEDYSELYDAASKIVDAGLREAVNELIDQCETDEDDVTVAYSIVTSDLIDPKLNDKNI